MQVLGEHRGPLQICTASGLHASNTCPTSMSSAHSHLQGTLSQAELYMCTALWKPMHLYDRGKVKGVLFACACERLQRNTKHKSCVVMSKIAWVNTAHGGVRVGIVAALFKYQPPWGPLNDPLRLDVADVAWIKPYNCSAELKGAQWCPKGSSCTVSKGTLSWPRTSFPHTSAWCLIWTVAMQIGGRWCTQTVTSPQRNTRLQSTMTMVL